MSSLRCVAAHWPHNHGHRGANIGLETVRGLLVLGFGVYTLSRNEDMAREAITLLHDDIARTFGLVLLTELLLTQDAASRCSSAGKRQPQAMDHQPQLNVMTWIPGMTLTGTSRSLIDSVF